MINKKSEFRCFDGYIKIDGAVFEDEKGEYNRFKVTRPDAVCAIVINVNSQEVILIKQHRYPIENKHQGNILEAVAGKIDAGESPREALKREMIEEIGYDAIDTNIHGPIEFFPSPGYTSEKIYCFIVHVADHDKVNEGGGLESEREGIELVYMPIDEFKNMVGNGEIVDGKTIMASNMLFNDTYTTYL